MEEGMEARHDVPDPDAVHEHEPLLSWGEPPIEEEDETLAPNGNMKKAPAVDAEHEPGIPSYEEVDLDSAALRAQGHEAALKRSFSPLAALGLGFSITNSWVGYLSCFGQNLVYGGPQSVVFGLLVATVVQWIITLGLSEVASAFPSSGGQYHFVFILAPRRHKQFAAFVVGWMTLLGWWIVTCSGISLCVVTVAGMINFWNNDFRATQWQLYLIYLATVFITSAPLFLCPRLVPKITQATLFLSVLGFLVSFALVIGLKKHTQSSSFITQPGLGTSGWRSGTAWVIGLGNAMYAYGGTDGAIHIAEEIPQPGRKVPQVMNLTMLIGFLTAFPLSVAMMYGVTDINAVVKSGLPSAEVFYQVTGRKPVVTFMMCWIILIYYCSSIPSTDQLETQPLIIRSMFDKPMGHSRPHDLGLRPRRKTLPLQSPDSHNLQSLHSHSLLARHPLLRLLHPRQPQARLPHPRHLPLPPLLQHLRPALPRQHHRLQLHRHIRRPIPQHHLRHPASHPPPPRPQQIAPRPPPLPPRPLGLRLQRSHPTPRDRHRGFHLLPAPAARDGREYELYPCYPGGPFRRHFGVLVHDGETLYGAED